MGAIEQGNLIREETPKEGNSGCEGSGGDASAGERFTDQPILSASPDTGGDKRLVHTAPQDTCMCVRAPVKHIHDTWIHTRMYPEHRTIIRTHIRCQFITYFGSLNMTKFLQLFPLLFKILLL